jgi:hypothetical protein
MLVSTQVTDAGLLFTPFRRGSGIRFAYSAAVSLVAEKTGATPPAGRENDV